MSLLVHMTCDGCKSDVNNSPDEFHYYVLTRENKESKNGFVKALYHPDFPKMHFCSEDCIKKWINRPSLWSRTMEEKVKMDEIRSRVMNEKETS